MAESRTLLVVLVVALATMVGAAVLVSSSPGGGVGEPVDETGDEGRVGPANAANTTSAASVVESQVPGWTRPDERLRVSVTLDGRSADSTTQTLALHTDRDGDGTPDRTLRQRQVELPAGESTEVTLTVPGGELAPGDHRLVATVGEARVTLSTVTVMEPPRLRFEEQTATASTVAGRPANVTATVRNGGEYAEPRTVAVALDRDGDGTFTRAETVDETTVTVAPGETETVDLALASASLSPGNYSYRWTSGDATRRGTLRVLAPATFDLAATNTTVRVPRGDDATLGATVTNSGDVAGTTTVTVSGPGGTVTERSLSLWSNASRNLTFTVPTADREAGTHSYRLATATDRERVEVRVQAPEFAVSALRGNETLVVGDPMVFAANVTNVGDAPGTATVSYRIDLDGDDRPEDDDITRQVTLAPGEERTVRFDIPYQADPDPLNQVETLPTGTYIYGIYTADDNETAVFEARRPARDYALGGGGGGGGDGGAGDDTGSGPGDVGPVSRAEIAQEKYGLFYDDLSAETQAQIDEIHDRQPFAGDRGVVDVLTREEIARQRYGLDVERGDNFEFSGIDVDLQQRIEAEFDAQFERSNPDRVESWDELARERYGTTYENLDADRQAAIERAYRDQFAD